MDSFGIGFGEILLIFILILIVWGPGKIPEIGRMLGRAVSSLRKATQDFTAEMTKEINEEKKELPSPPKQNSDPNIRSSLILTKDK